MILRNLLFFAVTALLTFRIAGHGIGKNVVIGQTDSEAVLSTARRDVCSKQKENIIKIFGKILL